MSNSRFQEGLGEKLALILEAETADGMYDSFRIIQRIEKEVEAIDLRVSFVLIQASESRFCLAVGLIEENDEERSDCVYVKIEH